MTDEQSTGLGSLLTMTQKVELDQKTIAQLVLVLVLVAVVIGLTVRLVLVKK